MNIHEKMGKLAEKMLENDKRLWARIKIYTLECFFNLLHLLTAFNFILLYFTSPNVYRKFPLHDKITAFTVFNTQRAREREERTRKKCEKKILDLVLRVDVSSWPTKIFCMKNLFTLFCTHFPLAMQVLKVFKLWYVIHTKSSPRISKKNFINYHHKFFLGLFSHFFRVVWLNKFVVVNLFCALHRIPSVLFFFSRLKCEEMKKQLRNFLFWKSVSLIIFLTLNLK